MLIVELQDNRIASPAAAKRMNGSLLRIALRSARITMKANKAAED